MSSDAADRTPLCPDCGALLEGDLAGCTQCGWRRMEKTSVPVAEAPRIDLPVAEVARPRAAPDDPKSGDFGYGASASAAADEATSNPYQAPQAAEVAGRTFGLGSLMLVMTLIGVLLGVAMVQPGIALVMMFVAAVALARTTGIIYRRKLAGGPATGTDKLLVFFASFTIITVISIASSVAFYAICWAGVGAGMAFESTLGGDPYAPLIVGMLGGIVVGIPVAIFVFYKLAKWVWRKD